MNFADASFTQVHRRDLEGYLAARAHDLGLTLHQALLPAVLENLLVLQSHAERLEAGLQAEGVDPDLIAHA